MDNRCIAGELLRVARLITTSRWDEKIVGNGCRIEWNNFNLRITELPAKGKKKLRVFRVSVWPGIRSGVETRDGANDLIIENLMRAGKVGKSSTYDQAKRGMEKAVNDVLTKWEREGLKTRHWAHMGEEQVHYLKVEPEDAKPITVKGKDFEFTSSWTNFGVREYHGDSGPQDMDPSYTDIDSTSPASARKLYKMLRADPNLLSNVSLGAFPDWLKKNKIKYELHFSVWH